MVSEESLELGGSSLLNYPAWVGGVQHAKDCTLLTINYFNFKNNVTGSHCMR